MSSAGRRGKEAEPRGFGAGGARCVRAAAAPGPAYVVLRELRGVRGSSPSFRERDRGLRHRAGRGSGFHFTLLWGLWRVEKPILLYLM